MRAPWSGNIREPTNLITATFFLAEGDTLTPADLQDDFRTARRPRMPTPARIRWIWPSGTSSPAPSGNRTAT
ncbi:hypothetical protein [Marinobacterium aestuariivivens]|uniref:NorR-like AAA+ ATPase lid domain-containing protein n=1 Tax=Marinobacterium aestuariivivens TaxID=1698799 RepID=A0ABW1ZW67_9GAMM